MSASKRYKIKRDLRREESKLGAIAAKVLPIYKKKKAFLVMEVCLELYWLP